MWPMFNVTNGIYWIKMLVIPGALIIVQNEPFGNI